MTYIPNSKWYNDLLIIVDRLTKYTIFIPYNFGTDNSLGIGEMAALWFFHVIFRFEVPALIIYDQDNHLLQTYSYQFRSW